MRLCLMVREFLRRTKLRAGCGHACTVKIWEEAPCEFELDDF
jgi:hypothetical protein